MFARLSVRSHDKHHDPDDVLDNYLGLSEAVVYNNMKHGILNLELKDDMEENTVGYVCCESVTIFLPVWPTDNITERILDYTQLQPIFFT